MESSENMKIAVLITCFNRKENTLSCLQGLYDNLAPGKQLDIYLVDDGCTDGTAAAIAEKYPLVNVIQGTGSLYWNGGMRLAWDEARKKDYDFYLWVNDDSMIYPDAIFNLIQTYNNLVKENKSVGAILGSMVDPTTKKLTYGGRNKSSGINPLKKTTILEPQVEPITCSFVNGNLTLIPKNTVNKIGILSDIYTHGMGDFDYGLRAQSVGLDCWIAPGIFGECEVNPIKGSWKDKTLDINSRVEKTKNITQLPPMNEWFHFTRQHARYVWPLLWLSTWLRCSFPKIWLLIKS
jgi:GT2 family glycosyltransferase